RYSVDEKWLVPHFEKMLYDNAQLLDLMTEVWREHRSPLLAERITETAEWTLREMVAEGGGFAASLDADSEGVEGKFYVWSEAEVVDVLGADDAKLFAEVYEVTASGNWEGTTILNRLNAMERRSEADETRLAEMREKLLARRDGRIRPGWDDKVLADWNGLMIAAMAKASDVFARADWLGAAARAYAFIVEHMTRDGRLLHAARAGEAKAPATSSDYANMIAGALQLTAVTGERSYVEDAEGWAAVLDRHYWSDELGGYHFTADDTADVIVRTLTGHDDATPNANGVMVSNLMQLWLLTGRDDYRARAEAIVQTFLSQISRNMMAHASLLLGGLDILAPQHIVIVGANGASPATDLKAALRQLSLPGAVVQVLEDPAGIAGTSPAAGKTALEGAPTAYVCVGPQCAAPVTEAAALVDTVRTMRTLPQELPEISSAS
ncbi:MAG: thioredoxin domain-containing protein, partial [Methyloligellaceae bacterium]